MRTKTENYLSQFILLYGHFSKFIRPGAKENQFFSRGQLLTTAFRSTDGKIAVVRDEPNNQKLPIVCDTGKARSDEFAAFDAGVDYTVSFFRET
jgi:hypothetical protein